jgi:hypothetical protein
VQDAVTIARFFLNPAVGELDDDWGGKVTPKLIHQAREISNFFSFFRRVEKKHGGLLEVPVRLSTGLLLSLIAGVQANKYRPLHLLRKWSLGSIMRYSQFVLENVSLPLVEMVK